MRSGKRGWKTSQLSDSGRAGLEVAAGRWNYRNLSRDPAQKVFSSLLIHPLEWHTITLVCIA